MTVYELFIRLGVAKELHKIKWLRSKEIFLEQKDYVCSWSFYFLLVLYLQLCKIPPGHVYTSQVIGIKMKQLGIPLSSSTIAKELHPMPIRM